MHGFSFIHAILHATAIGIIGFFVMFAASRSSGLLKTVGNVLGLVVFAFAILVLVAGVTAPMFGGKPFGMDMMGHHGWMHGPMGPEGPPPPPNSVAPPAAQPAAPAAPAKPKG
jgi:hypothetical protein